MSDNLLIEQIKSRQNFYRNHYHSLSTVLVGLLVLVFILNLVLVYLYAMRPIPDFYATSMDGKLIQLTPLNTPNYSSKPLI